jgi:prepilin-type N-terminal cleavage/methylation domain-containing protein
VRTPKGTVSSPPGFTLLEVVIAMTIVGLGVVTLFEIFSLGMRLAARSSVQTEAISHGRHIMDEFLARRTWQDGTEQGKADANSRWTLQVQTLREPSSGPPLASDWELKKAVLAIVVTDAGRERRMELNTIRMIKKESP